MTKLRWYDYGMCFMCADFISAGIISGAWLLTLVGVITYLVYEQTLKSTRTTHF
jgi:hypothetical protein